METPYGMLVTCVNLTCSKIRFLKKKKKKKKKKLTPAFLDIYDHAWPDKLPN